MKIRASSSATVEVSFDNANGFPAEVQGEIAWSSSNPEIATVEVDPEDNYFATVHAGPTAGFTTITASSDADLGEGVTLVSATLQVDVVARGVAVGGEIRPVSPDQGLPDAPDAPDQGLPTPPPTAGNELPPILPGRPTDPEFGIEAPGRPDQGLPDTAEPK